MRSLCLNLALVGGAAQSLPHSNVLSLTTKELAISPSHRYSVCDVRMSNDSAELGVTNYMTRGQRLKQVSYDSLNLEMVTVSFLLFHILIFFCHISKYNVYVSILYL